MKFFARLDEIQDQMVHFLCLSKLLGNNTWVFPSNKQIADVEPFHVMTIWRKP